MIKQYNVYEEVVKKVMPFGNGSIVYTPKKWVGQTVRVILEAEPLDLKEKVMEELAPFLERVKGVFLFGSFAREEQTPESDIDVLVLTDRPFKLGKKSRIDFTIIDEKTLMKELNGKDPFYLYNAIQEAKSLLNEELLESLKKLKINKLNFKWLLEESESALKIVEEFLKLDKQQSRKKLDSIAIIYTLVLRLKRLFLVECILNGNKFSNKEFKKFLDKKGLQPELVVEIYKIYQAERDDKTTEKSLSIEDAEKLYEIAKSEIKKMKEEYKWHQKRKRSKE